MEFETLYNLSKSEDGRNNIRNDSNLLEQINEMCKRMFNDCDYHVESELNRRLILIRTLRNVCCNDTDALFISVIISQRILFHSIAECRNVLLNNNSNSEVIESSDKLKILPLILSSAQLVANFTANGELAIEYFYNNSGTELITVQDLLAICTVCRSPKVISAVLAAIYNCIRISSGRSAARLNQFCANRSVLCSLLLLVMDNMHHTDDKQVECDEAVDWMVLIGAVLVRERKVLSILDLVGPSTSSSAVRVTHEQLILLQLTLNVLDDSFYSRDLIESYTDHRQDWIDLAVSLCGKIRALHIVLTIEQPAVDVTTAADTDAVVASIEGSMQSELKRDFVIIALQVVSSLLTVVSEMAECAALKEAMLATQIVEYVSSLIRDHHVGARISEKRNYSSTLSPHEEGVKCVVRSSLQVLGNIVYRCSAAQEMLRESGGLAVVLSHCATDFSNPLAREWALLCVRNATEENAANQQFIDSLRPQSVSIQDEKMKQQGMNVELNPQTGKFKFTQTPLQPPPEL